MSVPSWSNIVEQAKASITRFPLVYISSLALWLHLFVIGPGTTLPVVKTALFLIILGLLSISARIFAEQTTSLRSPDIIFSFICSLIVTWWFGDIPIANNTESKEAALAFLKSANGVCYFIAGLFALGLIAPYLNLRQKRNQEINAYWRQLGISLRYTCSAYCILILGFFVVLGTLKLFFAFNSFLYIFYKISTAITFIMLPAFLTVGIPSFSDAHKQSRSLEEKPQTAINLWLRVPLALVLLIVINLYSLSILLHLKEFEQKFLPINLVLCMYGVFIYIISYQQAGNTNKVETFFKNWLFVLLVIPCIYFAANGYVSVFVTWLFLNTAYGLWMTYQKVPYDLRIPVFSLSVMLLAAGLLKI